MPVGKMVSDSGSWILDVLAFSGTQSRFCILDLGYWICSLFLAHNLDSGSWILDVLGFIAFSPVPYTFLDLGSWILDVLAFSSTGF